MILLPPSHSPSPSPTYHVAVSKFAKCQKIQIMSSKIFHAIITHCKALLCTPQEGGPKVTEGDPYFRYIGAWGPHIYCKIRAGGPHLRGAPIFYDTSSGYVTDVSKWVTANAMKRR